MIRLIYISYYLVLLTSCSITRHNKMLDCDENQHFKKKFFYNISIIENYTIEQKTIGQHIKKIKTEDAVKSFQFISKYARVSPSIMSYDFGYPDLETFKKDKSVWIKWYGENKCSNLH